MENLDVDDESHEEREESQSEWQRVQNPNTSVRLSSTGSLKSSSRNSSKDSLGNISYDSDMDR